MQKTIVALLFVLCLSNAFKLDIPACIQGVADFSKQIKNIVDNASFEKQSMGKFLNNTFVAFQGLNPLLESCGLDYDFMDKVMSYKPTSQEQCFQSVANFIHHSNNTYAFSQNNKFTIENMLGNYTLLAGKMFTEAQDMYNHCWIIKDQKNMLSLGFADLMSNTDLSKFSVLCFPQAKLLTNAAISFVNNAISKNKTASELFVDAANIYNSAIDTLPLCGLNITLPKIDDINEKRYCFTNLTSIVKSVNQTVYDIKSKNWQAIPSELQNIFTNSMTMYKKCKINRKPILAAFQDCFSDSKHLIENIVALVNDIRNKEDISETIPQLYNLLKSLQPLVNSCGLNIDLHIHLIDVKDLQHCIKDFEAIEKSLVSLKNDLHEKKITNIAKDAAAIVSEVRDAITQCKASKLTME